jgi:hypothetical protein
MDLNAQQTVRVVESIERGSRALVRLAAVSDPNIDERRRWRDEVLVRVRRAQNVIRSSSDLHEALDVLDSLSDAAAKLAELTP